MSEKQAKAKMAFELGDAETSIQLHDAKVSLAKEKHKRFPMFSCFAFYPVRPVPQRASFSGCFRLSLAAAFLPPFPHLTL